MTTLIVQIFSPSKRAIFWPIAIAVLIFVASSRSKLAGPEVSGIDKVTHFAVYGLLGTLVVRNGRGPGAAAWSLVIVSAYGMTDEWHQTFTPGRSIEFADWLADTLGAAVAIALYTRWPGYRKFLETPLTRNRRIENVSGAGTVSAR